MTTRFIVGSRSLRKRSNNQLSSTAVQMSLSGGQYGEVLSADEEAPEHEQPERHGDSSTVGRMRFSLRRVPVEHEPFDAPAAPKLMNSPADRPVATM